MSLTAHHYLHGAQDCSQRSQILHGGIIPYDPIYSGFAGRLTAVNEQNMDKLPTFAH